MTRTTPFTHVCKDGDQLSMAAPAAGEAVHALFPFAHARAPVSARLPRRPPFSAHERLDPTLRDSGGVGPPPQCGELVPRQVADRPTLAALQRHRGSRTCTHTLAISALSQKTKGALASAQGGSRTSERTLERLACLRTPSMAAFKVLCRCVQPRDHVCIRRTKVCADHTNILDPNTTPMRLRGRDIEEQPGPSALPM